MIALYRPPRANAEVYNFVNNGIRVCVVRVDDESNALGRWDRSTKKPSLFIVTERVASRTRSSSNRSARKREFESLRAHHS